MTDNSYHSWLEQLATVGLGVALVPVTWWLIGDQSSRGFARDELDYLIRIPETFEHHATVAGVVGAIVAVLCLTILRWRYVRGDLDRGRLKAIVAVGASGIVAGGAARIITAGSIGANIGAGLVLLLVAAGLVALAVAIRSPQ